MKLLVSPEKVWFEIALPVETAEIKKKSTKLLDAERINLRQKASSLYEEQSKKYLAGRSMTPADREWYETVLGQGTVTDKISALLLQVQECPFYGLDAITKLLVMASSSSRHESLPAIDALKDIFGLILPPRSLGKELIPWRNCVLTGEKELTPSWALLVYYFEDVLRQSFVEFLKILEILLHDNLVNCRERSMRCLYEMCLSNKAEQGDVCLRLLANKLGDPDRKLSSRVVYYLQCIIEKHESLTLTIVKLVQQEAVKPNGANDKPSFYGLTFFSQVRLNEESPEVTEVLLDTYQHHLQLFLKKLEENAAAKRLKDKKDHKRRKLSSGSAEGPEEEEIPRTIKVVLSGLTRAIPFARSSGDKNIVEYAKKLVSIAGKIRSFPTLLQAASLVFQIFALGEAVTEETLQVISDLGCKYILDYTRLAENTSSHPKLFKLLYKIICAVGQSDNAKASKHLRNITKRLLEASVIVSNPAFPAAALLLVSEALAMKPGIRLAVTFPDDENEDEQVNAFWELNTLAKHYHPTVARYANTILSNKDLIDIGAEPEDPFASINNVKFLESFVEGTLTTA